MDLISLTHVNIDIQSNPYDEDLIISPIISFDQHRENILSSFSMNHHQRKTFDLFYKAYTSMVNKDEVHKINVFRVFTGGEGGTGKSRVINAIREFLSSLQQLNLLRIMAFTGSAAFQIQGNTVHKSLGMRKGTKNAKDKIGDATKLHAFWDSVKFIIIDEISMVSGHLLDMLDQKLRLKFNSNIPFAGRHVFFFGDFFQHAPIPNIPAYKSEVWNKLTHYNELKEQVRACKDPAYVEFLRSVRYRSVSCHQYNYLNTRL
jgi:hypothetical protein